MPNPHLEEVEHGDAGFLEQDFDSEGPKQSGHIPERDITDKAFQMGVVDVEYGLGRHLRLYSTTLLM